MIKGCVPTSIPNTLKRRYYYFHLFSVEGSNAKRAQYNSLRSHKRPRQDLNPRLSDLKPRVLSALSHTADTLGCLFQIPMCEETKAREVKWLAPGFMYTLIPYLEKDVFSRKEDSCLYKHSILTIQIGSIHEHEKREWIPIAQPQQMALLTLIHWGTGLLGEECLVYHASPATLCLRVWRTTYQN